MFLVVIGGSTNDKNMPQPDIWLIVVVKILLKTSLFEDIYTDKIHLDAIIVFQRGIFGGESNNNDMKDNDDNDKFVIPLSLRSLLFFFLVEKSLTNNDKRTGK